MFDGLRSQGKNSDRGDACQAAGIATIANYEGAVAVVELHGSTSERTHG